MIIANWPWHENLNCKKIITVKVQFSRRTSRVYLAIAHQSLGKGDLAKGVLKMGP